MGLTKRQEALLQRAMSPSGAMRVALTEQACHYLFGTIARDLSLGPIFPEYPVEFPDVYSSVHPAQLEFNVTAPLEPFFERLLNAEKEAETYFACLANLQRARLKYLRIIENQPIPTTDQVGPRGLLQYGHLSASALSAFLIWRKWLYDLDNRAGQETGYLFEPIVAHAIGGVPYSAKKSPVRRADNPGKGRQVDCVRRKLAYELKLRVTIAASGQGRWSEELSFPVDAKSSGYTPVLVVFDPTPNPKLAELVQAFLAKKGLVYVGDDAWTHLNEAAGDVMGVFLRRYVKVPLDEILDWPEEEIPELTLSLTGTHFEVSLKGHDSVRYLRTTPPTPPSGELELPDDVSDEPPVA